MALAALAAIAGILLADYVSLQLSWLAISICFLGVFGFYNRRNTLPLVALTATTFAFAHTLELRWINNLPQANALRVQHSESTATTATTDSSSQVSALGLVINEPSISPGLRRATCLLQLSSLTIGKQHFSSRHHIRLRIDQLPKSLRDIAYGDTLQISGQIYRLPQGRNPGSFSPADFYRRSDGAIAEIRCHPGHSIERLDTGGGSALIRVAHHSRDWLATAITRDLEDDPATASIITAMVLGAREDTPEAIEEQFRNSGALHIFAVSGLHIGLFGLIIWQLLKLFRVPRRVAVWLIIPAIIFYAIVTGLRPSACRAAVMGSIVLFSLIAGRRPRLINSLGLAALLLLAYDTQQLFLPGFQLSFTVLTAIAALTPFLMNFFGHPFEVDPFIPRQLVSRLQLLLSQTGSKAASYISVSLAAWLGSLPLIIYHFQLVTPVSILANCFLVPMAMLVLSLAVMSLSASLAQMSFLSTLFNNTNWLAAKTCSLLTAFFASLPGGHFHFSFTPPPVNTEHPVYIATLDTGSTGACHFISSRNPPDVLFSRRSSFLIDTGSSRNFQYTTNPFFRYRGINQFRSLYLTHNDAQHIGGATLITSRYHPEQIFTPPLLDSSLSMKNLNPILSEQQLTLTALTTGKIIRTSTGIKIETLFPPQQKSPGPRADDNSLVLRLHCSGWRILFMGDAGFETEKWLLENKTAYLASDVVIKGQHGSDISGLAEFLLAVDPLAIIASNQNFPITEQISPDWQEMLRERGIVLFDQQQSGGVEILAGPESLKIKGYLNDQSLTLSKRKP